MRYRDISWFAFVIVVRINIFYKIIIFFVEDIIVCIS